MLQFDPRIGDRPAFGYWVAPSGDRIVVTIGSLVNASEITDAVVMIVKSDDTGRHILWTGEAGPFPGGFLMQKGVMQAFDVGATEIHVHARAASGAERRTLVDRLRLWNEENITLDLAA